MNVIAERQLELRGDGGSIDVVVRLFRPVPGASGVDWECHYELQVGDTSRTMAMHGIDAMQALQLSMATLDVELEHCAKQRRGTLYHFDEPFTSILENSGLQVRK